MSQNSFPSQIIKALLILLLGFSPTVVQSNLSESVEESLEKIFLHKAGFTKKNKYLKSALVVGGNAENTNLILNKIRRGLSPKGYERVVFDIQKSTNGMPGYFQVSIEPGRLVVTLKGVEEISFNSARLKSAFRKSRLIKRVNVYPALNSKEAVVELILRKNVPVEAFELHKPSRIVLDLKIVSG